MAISRFLIIIIIFSYPLLGSSQNISDISNSGDTYAVVIGISNYQNVVDLEYTHKDALAFASFLQTKTGGNVPIDNIKLFIDEEATANNIGDAFTWLLNITKPRDRVYIFYAGHGDVESLESLNNGLLLLHKAPKESYLAFGYDYLPILTLKKVVLGLSSKETEIIVITDACHSGNLAGGETGIYSTSLQLMDQWSNSMKILSCQPDELSYEGPQWGGGHGVFSYYLVLGMGGMADVNNDSDVTLLELENYIEYEVSQQTAPSYQTPFTIGNLRKTITSIDISELKKIKLTHEKEVQTFSYVNFLSSDQIFNEYLENQDDTIQYYYKIFNELVDSGNLIEPQDSSAYFYFKKLQSKVDNETLKRLLERNFSAALQDKAMEIIVSVLELQKFYYQIEDFDLAATEMELAQELLGEKHYMYESITIRKLFLEAYSLSQKYIDNKDTTLLLLAESKLDSAIKLDPNSAYSYFQLGWIFNTRGEYKKALKTYYSYKSLVPNNPRAYNNLGYAYNALEQYDSAIIQFKKVVDLDSNYAKAYNNIGFGYALQGEFEESEKWFKIAILKDSVYQQAYYNLGLVYKFLNNYVEAEKYLLEAIELDTNDYDSHYNLACIFSINNDLEKSIFHLERAIESNLIDQDSLESDSDLDNIRNTKEFKKVLNSIK